MQPGNPFASLPVWLAPIAFAAGGATIALAVAFVVIDTSSSSPADDDAPPTPTTGDPGASPADPTATSTPNDPFSAVPLTIGDPVPFPANTSIVVAQGPHGRSWGVISIDRWTRGEGAVVRETLYSPPDDTRHISGVVAGEGSLFLGLVSGECAACLPFGDPEDRQTRIMESSNGGVSWLSRGLFEGVWIPTAAGAEGLVLHTYHGETVTFARLEAGDLVPFEAPVSGEPGEQVLSFRGQAAWDASTGALVDAAGATILELPGAEEFDIVGAADFDGSIAASLHPRAQPISESPGYLVHAIRAADGTTEITRAIRVDTLPEVPRFVAPFGNAYLVNAAWSEGTSAGSAPAIVDPISAALNPLSELQLPGAANRVLIITEGPTYRVNTPGDCLNIRSGAGIEAPVVTCAPHGVLLFDRQDAWDRDGVTWLAVRLPDGRAGWGSAEYLSR